MPSSLRKALNELPTTLNDTYERTLQGIPKEQSQHAHRLFQCLVAAIRPLHVEELAEIFAMEFDPDTVPHFVEDWRPESPEEAILSACSTLITVIEDGSSIPSLPLTTTISLGSWWGAVPSFSLVMHIPLPSS